MNTYPTLPTSYGSDPTPIDVLSITRTVNGTAHVKVLLTSDKSTIQIKHPSLTSSQKSTLDAFWTANRGVLITYVSPADGVSRTCYIKKQPAYVKVQSPVDLWDANVTIEES